MQLSSLPELGAAALLFVITLSMSYIIWHLLFGKRLPLKERKEKTERTSPLSLNEIMGYDFIQVKNFNQNGGNEPAIPVPTNTVTSDGPGLYATSNDKPDTTYDDSFGEDVPEGGTVNDKTEDPTEWNTVDISEEDMQKICDSASEPGMPADELELMSKYYNNYLPMEEPLSSSEGYNPTEQDMEHEAEMDKYREEMYNRYMDSCATDESDRAALLELGGLISGQDGESADDVDPDDLPDIS